MKTKPRYQVKRCRKCDTFKSYRSFYTSSRINDGLQSYCKICCKDTYRKRHREDKKAIWKSRYKDMKKRVDGKNPYHNGAVGKQLCSREDFLRWCQNNKDEFDRLYEVWKASGFAKKYAPSIDRINNDKGYTLDNIRWVVLSKNAKGGGKSP